MLRIMIGLILAVGVLSVPSAVDLKESNLSLDAQITIVQDLDEARLLYPGIEFIQMEKSENTKGLIQYTLGNRVNGDRLVAQGSDGTQWAQPQNVQLSLQYPQSGTGATVSYVHVIVDQSSNLGSGYVVSGGIGQRRIAILIEAKNTLWCRWQAAFYGI